MILHQVLVLLVQPCVMEQQSIEGIQKEGGGLMEYVGGERDGAMVCQEIASRR